MNPHMLIGARLSTLMNLVKRHSLPPDVADEEAADITRMQGMIIGFLCDREGGALQKEIEEAFLLRPSTVSRTLKLMDKNGLIERVYLQDDARQKKIVVTPKAMQAHAGIQQRIKAAEEQLVKGISPEDLEVFHKVLTQMTDNMNV